MFSADIKSGGWGAVTHSHANRRIIRFAHSTFHFLLSPNDPPLPHPMPPPPTSTAGCFAETLARLLTHRDVFFGLFDFSFLFFSFSYFSPFLCADIC